MMRVERPNVASVRLAMCTAFGRVKATGSALYSIMAGPPHRFRTIDLWASQKYPAPPTFSAYRDVFFMLPAVFPLRPASNMVGAPLLPALIAVPASTIPVLEAQSPHLSVFYVLFRSFADRPLVHLFPIPYKHGQASFPTSWALLYKTHFLTKAGTGFHVPGRFDHEGELDPE